MKVGGCLTIHGGFFPQACVYIHSAEEGDRLKHGNKTVTGPAHTKANKGGGNLNVAGLGLAIGAHVENSIIRIAILVGVAM